MAMPKTTVDKHDPLPTTVRDVRRSRKIPIVDAEANAERVEHASNRQLAGRAVLAYPAKSNRRFGVDNQARSDVLDDSSPASRGRHESDDRTHRFAPYMRQMCADGIDKAGREPEFRDLSAR